MLLTQLRCLGERAAALLTARWKTLTNITLTTANRLHHQSRTRPHIARTRRMLLRKTHCWFIPAICSIT
jgi:hypothetical protein